MKFFIKDFFSIRSHIRPAKTADLVTFTEKIHKGIVKR